MSFLFSFKFVSNRASGTDIGNLRVVLAIGDYQCLRRAQLLETQQVKRRRRHAYAPRRWQLTVDSWAEDVINRVIRRYR